MSPKRVGILERRDARTISVNTSAGYYASLGVEPVECPGCGGKMPPSEHEKCLNCTIPRQKGEKEADWARRVAAAFPGKSVSRR